MKRFALAREDIIRSPHSAVACRGIGRRFPLSSSPPLSPASASARVLGLKSSQQLPILNFTSVVPGLYWNRAVWLLVGIGRVSLRFEGSDDPILALNTVRVGRHVLFIHVDFDSELLRMASKRRGDLLL